MDGTGNFVTLNCNGLKSNFVYTKELISQHHCIFLTETWLVTSEEHLLSEFNSRFKIITVPAKKKNAGRPFGGTALLLDRTIFDKTDIIILEDHLTIVKTIFNDISLTITGVYLPSTNSNDYIENYKTQLSIISGTHQQLLSSSEVIILGDFQSCPTIENSQRNTTENHLSQYLNNFIKESNLYPLDMLEGTGPLYTYHHLSMSNKSYIDHIFVSDDLKTAMSNTKVLDHHPLNTGDHLPITTQISTSQEKHIATQPNPDDQYVPNYMWNNAKFTEKYNELTDQAFTNMSFNYLPIETELENLNSILKECASKSFMEMNTSTHKVTPKPWWNRDLTRAREKLQQMFNLWKYEGFPKSESNVAYGRYKFARKSFRYLVRQAKNQASVEHYIGVEKLKNIKPRSYWQKIRLNKVATQKLFTVNNKTTTETITEEFANHFDTILNEPRVSTTDNTKSNMELKNLLYDIRSEKEDFFVTQSEVVEAINKLNKNKARDPHQMVAEHFQFAKNEKVRTYITYIINRIFTEHETPKSLSVSLIIPLVKSYKKSMKDPNNYRGISLMPILAKIIEAIILKKCPILKAPKQSQYGFTNQTSTIHAELMIQETINYYNTQGSPVYMCSLDATKAFDSCNWHVMFKKLLDKNLPKTIIQFLIAFYLQSDASVLYNGNKSKSFDLSQGVKQGSLLSPYLYNIYTETLLDILKETNAGTVLPDGTKTSVIAFADDLLLMSPTLRGLQMLINKCLSYGKTHNISFNHIKTQFVISGNPYFQKPMLAMNGKLVQPQETMKHLGFIWKKHSGRLLLKHHMEYRLSEMWSVVSSLISSGVRHLHPNQITQLLQSLVIPKLLYGLEIVKLSNTERQYLNRQARCALKQLFGISKHAKNLINQYYKIKDIEVLLDTRKIDLIYQLSQNKDTSKYVIHLMFVPNSDRSFSIINNLLETCLNHDKDFLSCIFNRSARSILNPGPATNSSMDLDVIHDCVLNWHLYDRRLLFKETLEAEIER